MLARAALDLEAARTGPGLAFHARGAIHDDLLTAVADLIGAEHADTRDALLEALDDAPDDELVMIAVDALDEAASSPDRDRSPRRSSSWPRCRDSGWRWPPGRWRPATATNSAGCCPRSAITSADSPALVDLDTDRYFEPDGLRQFAAAVLTQHQARHPNPADAAWTIYRADSRAMRPAGRYDRRPRAPQLPGRRDGGRPAVGRGAAGRSGDRGLRSVSHSQRCRRGAGQVPGAAARRRSSPGSVPC